MTAPGSAVAPILYRSPGLAYGAVMLGVLGHASSEFVAVLTGVSGPEQSVWRFLLGGLGLVVIALLVPASRDLWTPLRERFAALVGLSLLGVTGGYLLFHWSLDFATVPQVAILVTTIPIFVALVNAAVSQQWPAPAKLLTGAAAVLGVALLITDGYLARLAGSTQSLVGVLLATGCAALVAAFTVLVRPIIGQYGALRITAITLFLGALGLWLVVGLAWGIWVNPATLTQRPPEQVTALVALALWNTTITQWLWIGGLAAVPDITRGSYLFFLKPIIATGLAVGLLQQGVTGIQLWAMAIICGAVVVEFCWPRRESPTAVGKAP
ncbi:MAG: DMT family transporter [Candidatus Competibacterales bacterium]